MNKIRIGTLILIIFCLAIRCQNQPQQKSQESLKEAYSNLFLIGTAVTPWQISGKDTTASEFITQQFNSVTPENALKWEKVHPLPDSFCFDPVDDLVEFGEKNSMFIVGHTLVWHNQTPAWVFEQEEGKPATREQLLKRLKEHIFTVVGRYKGRIQGWDVINEAIDEQGNFRKTKWYEIIGEEYIGKAFQWAHEADPDAELYYNDYNMWYAGKRDAVVKLVQYLQLKDIAIHGVGLQGHWGLDYPPLDELEACINAYSGTGLNVMVTEMDISVLPFPDSNYGAEITKRFEMQKRLNPYAEGLPDSVQVMLSQTYANLFRLFVKYRETVSRITFWGLNDGISWKNDWPVPGRTDYPLLFDRNFKPKRAYYEVIKIAGE